MKRINWEHRQYSDLNESRSLSTIICLDELGINKNIIFQTIVSIEISKQPTKGQIEKLRPIFSTSTLITSISNNTPTNDTKTNKRKRAPKCIMHKDYYY